MAAERKFIQRIQNRGDNMADNNTEREFMMVIRQAAQMIRAHIARNRATLNELAFAIDSGLLIVVRWIEIKYEIKRPARVK